MIFSPTGAKAKSLLPICVAALFGGALASSCSGGLGPAPTGTPLTVADTPTRARTPDGQYISWKEHLIDDEQIGGVVLRGGDGLRMADLDQDGYLDIVSVHEDNHHIRLAFGSANPDQWELATLAEKNEAKAAEDVSIADANGDGLLDIVAACELAHLIYFQNPGKDIRAGRWPRVIPAVTQDRGSFIRVFFADFDGDGHPEVTAPNKGEQLPGAEGYEKKEFPLKEILWYRLPPNPLDGKGWKAHVLTRVKIPINAQPIDLDGDGDLDILGGSRGEARIFWFENLGGGEIRFQEHRIEVSGRHVPQQPGGKRLTGMNVVFHDLSGDGRVDLVLQETPTLVVWLEQPAKISEPWQIHRIGDLAPDSSTGLALADINSDGRLDLITGGYSQNPRDHDGENITAASSTGRLAWFEQPEDPAVEWIRHDISRRKRGMYDAFIPQDMDRDGDVDFVTTRGNSGNFDGVLWLEQVRTAEAVKSFQPARTHESAHLPLPPE